MPEISQFVGWVAGTLTTLCFVPQVVKVLKERNTTALSLPMYVAFAIGVSCWLVYGFLTESLPIIAANSVTLILALTIIFMKIKHK